MTASSSRPRGDRRSNKHRSQINKRYDQTSRAGGAGAGGAARAKYRDAAELAPARVAASTPRTPELRPRLFFCVFLKFITEKGGADALELETQLTY